MKLFSVALLTISTMFLAGCTENIRAKTLGGTAIETLAPNTKLVNVTWKDDELWILTRPSRPGENPETYKFIEKSRFGIIEGKVVIRETR